jgi:hypothetical protein
MVSVISAFFRGRAEEYESPHVYHFSEVINQDYFTSVILDSWERSRFFVLLFHLRQETSCWINYDLSVNLLDMQPL